MRTRVFVVGLLLWISTAVQVGAVSVRDIVELSRAGLGDEVILALIDIDPVQYDLDAQRVLELKDAGVSERVLAAMLRSAPVGASRRHARAAGVRSGVRSGAAGAAGADDDGLAGARADHMARVPDCRAFACQVGEASAR